MPRQHRFALAAIPLALLAFAAFAASQGQAPRAQAQVPPNATPVDHMTWSGHFDLVQEIRERMAEAKTAEAERAAVDGDDTTSIAYLRAVREVWEDDRLRDAPAIVEAGVEIIRFHAFRHDQQRRLDATVEVLAVLDANRERWLALADSESLHEMMGARIDLNIRAMLKGLQNASAHGRPHLELAGLDRRIAKPYNAERREELELQRDKLRERMAAGEFGPDERPPPAR